MISLFSKKKEFLAWHSSEDMQAHAPCLGTCTAPWHMHRALEPRAGSRLEGPAMATKSQALRIGLTANILRGRGPGPEPGPRPGAKPRAPEPGARGPGPGAGAGARDPGPKPGVNARSRDLGTPSESYERNKMTQGWGTSFWNLLEAGPHMPPWGVSRARGPGAAKGLWLQSGPGASGPHRHEGPCFLTLRENSMLDSWGKYERK